MVKGATFWRTILSAVSLVALTAGPALAEKPKEAPRRWLDLPVFRERDAARSLSPHQIDRTPEAGAARDARAIRLRIYADRDYRELVLRWKVKARAQIDRINAVVQPVFGVRFEIESLRDWDRSHVGLPLDPVLTELEALDPAEEVDWVLGLTTPFHGVATSAHHIGLAHLLARHFVMRGTDDEEEARALEREFKLLSPEERRTLYADRKGHKDIVMFLHEWGHTMGLLHNEDRSIFMNPSYDARETAFSDFERHVIALVLERRLARRAELYPESADLLPLLETAPHEEGSDSDRARLLELARGRARARTRRIGAPAGAGLPAPDVEAFNQAVEAANAGRLEDAWKLLSPVLQRAGTRKAGGGPLPGETWLRLAELAAGAGALSAADDAATRAGAQDPEALKLSAKIESTRHRIALPLDAAQRGVPPDREPAYVAGYNQMAAAINSSSSVADMARARSLLRDFAAAFPGAPGADVLGCDLELKARRPAVATRSCEAALDKFKGATRAHYLLAFMATSGATAAHKPAVAEQHLRQVIAMDPSDADAWRALVRLYRETRAKRSLAELAEQHQALLSSPLPE